MLTMEYQLRTQTFFDRSNISTPGAVGGRDGCTMEDGKNTQLADLCKRLDVEMGEVERLPRFLQHASPHSLTRASSPPPGHVL